MTITMPGATAGVTADGLESLASLDDICALPLQETVERAAAALGHLVHDTGFVPLEVLPLLQTAHEARGWYVALQQDVGKDSREGPSSSCSLQVFVWPSGSWTRIHDHSSWGVFCCVVGRVQEERYERLDDGTVLEHARLGKLWQRAWSADDKASTVLPYDDGIHRVGNPYGTMAISVHLYGPRVGEVDGRDYDPSRDYVCDRLET